ncbi:MAG: hypothetical protein SAK29_24505 [Scytonema sp. PMC 1069.18]|nr:hypothetical protein [Scytonema sp. PMC 1069.18]MEC4881649.1 hypothetical protein [Scytonema sp. PMC 1070.18]
MITKGHLESPPQVAVEPLLELREYYVSVVEEYERLCTHARSQLAHVEALLSNMSGSEELDNQMAVVETLSFAPTSAQQNTLFEKLPHSVSTFQQEEAIQPERKDNSKQDIVLDEESPQNGNRAIAVPVTSSKEQKPIENYDRSALGSDVPMLPHYQTLSRLEAIEKILHENVGTVCHIDFIVRALYGDLESNVFKVVKSRVQSSLTHGKEKSYWSAVPDEPGCYTLDLNLVTSADSKNKSKALKPKKKKPFMLPKARRVSMLPEYEGKFLIDAICILLQKNSGRVFSVADVILGLYGEIDAEQLREIKTAVHNELSRGHRIGRFSRVPEKLGYYSWDLSKIQTK